DTENAREHDLGRRRPGWRLGRRGFLRRWGRFDAKNVAFNNREERIAALLVLLFIGRHSRQGQRRKDSPQAGDDAKDITVHFNKYIHSSAKTEALLNVVAG